MAVDYDLVIVGGTAAARWAARTAVYFHARVALVGHQRYTRSEQTVTGETPAGLASLGIDVVDAEGEFFKKPYLHLLVEGRELRSRQYLLALHPPQMPSSSHLTVDEAYAIASEDHQVAWFIMGDGPTALQLSQHLIKLGANVTVAARKQLLPEEEPEAAILIQAQLEANGVCILTHTPNPSPEQIPGRDTSLPLKIVQAEEGQTTPTPMLQSLGLTHTSQGIWVDSHLRTSHPRIYACGPLLGGYALPAIARQEASLAVKNALFWATRAINYQQIPWAILTEPSLARVGLTTTQAQQQYRNIRVLQRTYQTLEAAHKEGQIMGLCRLIVRENGILVGAHLVGTAAAEMIQLLALAVQQQRKVHEIVDWAFIDGTFSDIISQTVQEQHSRRSLLERLFHRRRRWNL